MLTGTTMTIQIYKCTRVHIGGYSIQRYTGAYWGVGYATVQCLHGKISWWRSIPPTLISKQIVDYSTVQCLHEKNRTFLGGTSPIPCETQCDYRVGGPPPRNFWKLSRVVSVLSGCVCVGKQVHYT
jgi:hypothetical protein